MRGGCPWYYSLLAVGVSLVGHGLLLWLPMPGSDRVEELMLTAEATDSTEPKMAVVALSEVKLPEPVESPLPEVEGNSVVQEPEQRQPMTVGQPSLPEVIIPQEETAATVPNQTPATPSEMTAEANPDDSSAAGLVQFQQFWAGLGDRALDAGSLADTLELFGTPHQATLFVDEQGRERSHLETFVLLPRQSPAQALADLIQPQLSATAACNITVLADSPHQEAGGGAVYATQCGPLRQYLNLVPVSGGTLIVLWREEP